MCSSDLAATSAAATLTTVVPEPPLGDQKHTSTGASPPRRRAPDGRARSVGEGRGERRHGTGAGARGQDPGPNLACVEAAFFDLDKTVIANSSVIALGSTLYRDGLISRSTIVRGLYAQVVYLLVGADEGKMERMREAVLGLTRGWDQAHVEALVRDTLDDVIIPIKIGKSTRLNSSHT